MTEPSTTNGPPCPYENLVLEGGGAKGYAYVGALKELEELGWLRHFRRFAGASAGAIMAAYLALKAPYDKIKQFSDVPMLEIAEDATCSSWSVWRYIPMLNNVLRYYGWHSGDGVLNYLKSTIQEICGDPDITFIQAYEKYGTELCVSVANVSKMRLEFFHPKLTPEVEIAVAVRMSMSIPGYFRPVKYHRNGTDCYYVDGGLLCNYPIHCFDGWYLSMKPENSILNRLASGTAGAPFSPENEKTLGIVVYSATENDYMKPYVNQRYERVDANPWPSTKLSRERKEKVERFEKSVEKYEELFKLAKEVGEIILEAQAAVVGEDVCVTKDSVISLLNKIGKDRYEKLTGEEFDPESAYHAMEKECEGNDKMLYSALVRHLDTKGLFFRELSKFNEFTADTGAAPAYFSSVLNSVRVTTDRYYLKRSDAARTVGIDTQYLEVMDFKLEEGDKAFLIKQGSNAVKGFMLEKIQMQGPRRFAASDRDRPTPRGGLPGPDITPYISRFEGIITPPWEADPKSNFADKGISIY